MRLTLTRVAYTTTETQGRLVVGDDVYQTIERPWIPGPHPGGMSFQSCIPDGLYQLRPHTRPNGDQVVALVNPELGVWYREHDRPHEWGRYLILLHSANKVSEVVGCVAPGMDRTIYQNEVRVVSSRVAMGQIMPRLHMAGKHSILIRPTEGTQ